MKNAFTINAQVICNQDTSVQREKQSLLILGPVLTMVNLLPTDGQSDGILPLILPVTQIRLCYKHPLVQK
jgi:hypothetical protein